MKFIYIGQCAAGFVQFTNPKANDETVVMPQGEAVEVPDWIAGKLANNSHFQAVKEEEPDESGKLSDGDSKPPRGKPGPKPKPKAEDA